MESPFTTTVDSKTANHFIELQGVPNNRLVLDNVYLNGLHALRRFYIVNKTASSLLIKLRSNLGDQIAFQLTNENFPETECQSTKFPTGNQLPPRHSGSTPRLSSNSIDSSVDSVSADIPSLLPSARNSILDVSPSSSVDFGQTSLNQNTVQSPQNTSTLTTNTSDAAAFGLLISGGGGAANPMFVHGHQFNQLFNFVNHIEELVLEPYGTQQVIVAFLPDEKHTRIPKSSDPNGAEPSDSSLFLRQGGIEEAHDFAEINGLIFLFAYLRDQKDNLSNSPDNVLEKVTSSGVRSLPTSRPTSSKGSKLGGDAHRTLSLARHDGINPSASVSRTVSHPDLGPIPNSKENNADTVDGLPVANIPDQQLSVKFRSRVCKTVLATDIESGGIVFDDCVMGGSYFKDFTIWNRSEIDLYFGLTTVDIKGVDTDSWIQFSDYDSGDLLTTVPIPAYSPKRIRISFKPQEIRDVSYDFQIENLNDSKNTIQFSVHAFVRSTLREELLVVNTGSSLDFGDCVAGSWRKQKIALRNVSEQLLDVSLMSDTSCVMFQLVLGDDDQVNATARYQDTNVDSGQFSSDPNTRHNHFHPRRRRQTHESGDDILLQQGHETPPPQDNPNLAMPVAFPAVIKSFQTDSLPTASPASFERILIDKLQTVSSSIKRQKSDISPTHTSSSSIDSSPSRKDNIAAPDHAVLDVIDMPRPHSRASSSLFLGADDFGGNSPRTLQDKVRDEVPLAEETTRIEELQLRPGSERILEVCYRPTREPWTSDFRAGRLSRKTFRITITYAQVGQSNQEKKVIQCVARACTSFIQVLPKELDFGDSDVGTLNSRTIRVHNRSDVPGQIEMRYMSKVLSTVRGEIQVPPQQHIEVKVDIYPRKVNPDYSKQITVVNILNRDNDEVVHVRSNNIDKQRVTFHSLFYHVLTSTSTNYLDFGFTVLNNPAVRTFTIQNLSKKVLRLEIIPSAPEELRVFIKAPEQKILALEPREAALQRREKLIESIDDRRRTKRSTATADNNSTLSHLHFSANTHSIKPPISHLLVDTGLRVDSSTPTAEYLDLASESPGWKSPKRKSTKVSMAQVAQLKGLRQKLLRERNALHTREESVRNSVATDISNNQKDNPSEITNIKATDVLEANSPLILAEDEEGFDLAMNAATGTRVHTDTLLQFLEKSCGTPAPTFAKLNSEEKYVKYQYWLKRELQASIDDHRLIPASTLEIAPEASLIVIVMLSPSADLKPFIQGKPKKHDGKLFIKLVDFDRDISQPQFESLLKGPIEDIPVREIMIRSTLYRSIMELGQKNINFGATDKHVRLSKSILIRNNSEAPLLYTIRKSGSVASGDLIFYEGRMGVIRPYGKREVEFVFEPSLSGPYQEKLTIENIQDPENHQTVTVKATVRQPANFFVESMELDFGTCMSGERGPKHQYIILSNTSQKHIRTFEIHYDPNEYVSEGFSATLEFDLVEGDLVYEEQEVTLDDGTKQKHRRLVRKPPMMLSSEAEEQIEQLEQKLKIAHRKGRKDKVKKIMDRLKRLKAGQPIDEYGETESATETAEPSATVLSDAELAVQDTGLVDHESGVRFRKIENGIIFSVGPRCIQKVRVTIIPRVKEPESNSPSRLGSPGIMSPKSQILCSDKSQVYSPSGIQSPAEGTVDSHQQDLKSRLCSGLIYVNETKNSDVIKKIRFQAIVCLDHLAYLQNLAAESDRLTREGLVDEAATLHHKMQIEQSTIMGTSPPMSTIMGLKHVLSNETSHRASEISLATSMLSLPYSNTIPPIATGSYDSSGVSTAIPPSQVPKSIEVEVSVIDLGRLELGERKECYFTVRNLIEQEIDYSIVLLDSPALLQFGDMSGTLNPLEVKKVDMWLMPFRKGRMVETFRIITSSGQESSVTFTCYGVLGRYLDFKLLDSSKSSIPVSELDFGYCFVDASRKYAARSAIVIENVTPDDILVTTTSNLAQQCFIFKDPDLESPANELQIPGGQQRTVYVVLQPYVSGSINAMGGKKDGLDIPLLMPDFDSERLQYLAAQTECRNLVGGLKFNVLIKEPLEDEFSHLRSFLKKSSPSADSNMTLSTQTLKFKAIIGQSLFLTSCKTIHFGVVKKGDIVSSKLGLYNLSAKLPLDVNVKLSALSLLSVHPSCLHLDAITADETSIAFSEPQALPRLNLDVSLRCARAGLVSETIELINVHNSLQSCRVNVEAFVDPGLVEIHQLSRSAESNLPYISFDDIYVVPSPDITDDIGQYHQLVITKRYRHDMAPVYEKSFEIENLTDELLQLIPWSDTNVSVRWLLTSTSGFVVEAPSSGSFPVKDIQGLRPVVTHDIPVPGCSAVGTKLLLHPKEKATMIVSLMQLKPIHNIGVFESILAGARGTQRGSLFLFNPDRGFVCNAIDLVASFSVSLLEIDPVRIDLGKIGHFNSWQDVRFTVNLQNRGELPLYCELEFPDSFELAPIVAHPSTNTCGAPENSSSDASLLRKKLLPKSNKNIDILFKPRRIEHLPPGSHSSQLMMINSYNPQNAVPVTVTFTLTHFELKFDRLTSGEIMLPTLSHPTLQSSMGSDNWFTITNISQDEVKFDIGATIAPDVKDILSIEISSRFSNSPITGLISLPSKGILEVRVKAIPLNICRLSSQDDHGVSLINANGITFGTLWIVSRNQQYTTQDGQEEPRMAENIPIRGTLYDEHIFSLTPDQIVFHAVVQDDEETPNEAGMDDETKKQKETIYIKNLSNDFPLEFMVEIDYPIELANGEDKLALKPLNQDFTGIVPPNSTLPLTIELLDPSIGGISRDIFIHVIDLRSVTQRRETVALHIIEDQSGKLKPIPHEDEDSKLMQAIALPPAELNMGISAQDVLAHDAAHSEAQSRTSLVSNEYGGDGILSDREREAIPSDEPSIVEKISSSLTSHSKRETDSISTPLAVLGGLISLKGCKKLIDPVLGEFQGLYSLDLGQLDISNTPFTKRIILQNNTSPTKLSYRIKCLYESDHLWMACSRLEGQIEPLQNRNTSTSNPSNSQTITLSLMVSMRGSYTSYLIIENTNNRLDTKIIRVSMEVVAKGNYRRYAQPSNMPTSLHTKTLTAETPSSRVFDVYGTGIDLDDCRIELSDVILDNLYASRSLAILNHDIVPLDFTVKSSLTRDDESELVFSLSRTSAKLCRSITIEPESHARVYLRFWAARDSCSVTGVEMPSSGTGLTLAEANTISQKRFDIYVNCRLVRDYQKVIPLVAYCRHPQILLSQFDFRFSGIFRRSSAEDEVVHHIHFAPTTDTFSITNLLVDDILEYEIVSDSEYFRLELVPNESDLDRDISLLPPPPDGIKSGRTSTISQNRALLPSALFDRPSKKLFSTLLKNSIPALQSQSLKILPNLPAMLQDTEFLRKERYIMDHFVIYNRKRPFEKYRIQVSLSFGHIDQFQFAVGSRRSITALESHIVRFLRMIESSVTALSGSSEQKLHESDTFRLYQYIIDELISYGSREQGSAVYIQLATLLFTRLFSNPFFRELGVPAATTLPFFDNEFDGSPQQLWVSRFLYFMGFFPLKIVAMDSLRELSKRFVTTTQSNPPESIAGLN